MAIIGLCVCVCMIDNTLQSKHFSRHKSFKINTHAHIKCIYNIYIYIYILYNQEFYFDSIMF